MRVASFSCFHPNAHFPKFIFVYRERRSGSDWLLIKTERGQKINSCWKDFRSGNILFSSPPERTIFKDHFVNCKSVRVRLSCLSKSNAVEKNQLLSQNPRSGSNQFLFKTERFRHNKTFIHNPRSGSNQFLFKTERFRHNKTFIQNPRADSNLVPLIPARGIVKSKPKQKCTRHSQIKANTKVHAA